MARDSSLQLRKAIVTSQRADAGITALIPASRVYGEYVPPDPVKPFSRYGTPTKTPDINTGQDGVRVLLTFHAFASGPTADAVANIGAAIVSWLGGDDGKGLVLELDTPYPAKATLTWTGGQTLPDPEEASLWHEVVTGEAVVSS